MMFGTLKQEVMTIEATDLMYSRDEVEVQIPPDKISYACLLSQLFFESSLSTPHMNSKDKYHLTR